MGRLAMAVNEAAVRERTHCGSNRQTVCNWERGQVPHPDTLRWIAAALGVPVEPMAEARTVQVRLTRRQLIGNAALGGWCRTGV
jgi:transcriptional regulator with XRE-family HTH domain